jgi:cellulose synthase/poly-beta-1,6-N-acetylglucosamine synthase-like glycosyltransferase
MPLRKAPKFVQTERILKGWDFVVFILLTCLNLYFVEYFFSAWFAQKSWQRHPIVFAALLCIFAVIVLNYMGRWLLLPCMRRPLPMQASSGWRVAVVTTIIPGAESLEMLEQTLKAMVGMQYPHDVWVLDEKDDDRVKKLCSDLGAKHFSRRNMPQYQTEGGIFQSHTKYGNYNSWLNEIGFDRYDIIASFDPDHIPHPDFLTNVLGYFDDPSIGYVQAAQAYYNQKASFIARGAAEETYAYYSSIQMASYGLGYPIIVGCHNIHRAAALKQVGGFAPHDADDVLLTIFYRTHNWQGVYVPRILARGLTPVDWRGYLIQQRRWARSVLDIKFRLYLQLFGNLPLKTRVASLFHGLNYLYKNLVIFLALGAIAIMLITGYVPRAFSGETAQKLGLMALVLLVTDFFRQRFYLDRRNESGFHWRVAVLQLAKWPFMLLAFCDVLLKRRFAYILTSKVKENSRHHVLLKPFLALIIAICAAWAIGTVSGRITSATLHVTALAIVIGSIALILSEYMSYPAPYDKSLSPPVGEVEIIEQATESSMSKAVSTREL